MGHERVMGEGTNDKRGIINYETRNGEPINQHKTTTKHY